MSDYLIYICRKFANLENAGITQVLKENQERIIIKVFKRISNNDEFPQSQQKTSIGDIQDEDIQKSINLPCVNNSSEW